MNLKIAILGLMASALMGINAANACIGKTKEVTLPGSSFGSFKIYTNCGARMGVGMTWISLGNLAELKAGKILDQGGQTIGELLKVSPRKVVVYSVGANGRVLPAQPRLEVVLKSDNQILVRAIKNNALVGTAVIESTGCRRSSPKSEPGTVTLTIDGYNLKTAGSCGAGQLEATEFEN